MVRRETHTQNAHVQNESAKRWNEKRRKKERNLLVRNARTLCRWRRYSNKRQQHFDMFNILFTRYCFSFVSFSLSLLCRSVADSVAFVVCKQAKKKKKHARLPIVNRSLQLFCSRFIYTFLMLSISYYFHLFVVFSLILCKSFVLLFLFVFIDSQLAVGKVIRFDFIFYCSKWTQIHCYSRSECQRTKHKKNEKKKMK